jgi:VWFA-related protein
LLRVTVNLVQVDAVVTDSKGNQITNLTADDFVLLQDGKPQKITHFSYISTAAATSAPVAPTRVTPVKGIPAPPPMKLRPDQIRRTVAMVVDDLGLSFESPAIWSPSFGPERAWAPCSSSPRTKTNFTRRSSA